ncbi:unnamed protein product, partial [Ascophyllum nodosum]
DLGAFASIKLKHPVAESEGDWYDGVPTSVAAKGKHAKRPKDKGIDQNPASQDSASPEMVAQARAAGKALFDAEVEAWTARKGKHATSDDKWVEQARHDGTLSDKVAALTLKVQESPLHRLGVLDGLLDLGLKKERRTAQMALEALKDLFVTNLLPNGRKLIPFELRPLSQVFVAMEEASSVGGDGGSGQAGGARKAITATVGTALLMWYFEDQIRARFYRMVGAIEAGSRDTVENFKRFSLEAAKDLLEAKPEGEQRLLALLVNKLGDPEKKISGKAIHLLQTILATHPAMKGVVVREVQQCLHRPGLQPKALYAGIVFLNQQVYLRKDDDAALASSMVQTYLRLFEAATSSPSPPSASRKGKKGASKNASSVGNPGTGTRLLSALLTGVNRARPYLPVGDSGVEGSIGSLFRVVHTEGFATATQALSLLFQVVSASPNPDLPDHPSERRRSKVKRPEATASTEALAGGETGTSREERAESIRARFYSALYAKLLSPDFGGASNPVLFLNLLYKAIKADHHAPRAAAFAKRLLQVCSVCDAPLAAAGLFVVSEALKKHPDLRSALFERATRLPLGRDDSAEGASGDIGSDEKNASNGRTGGKGLDIPGYDCSKRDPRFSFSGSTLQPLWEVSLLRSHVHPSVSKFADGLSSLPKHAVDYRGDPLADFALMPFLDRMAYRNPKTREPKRVGGVSRSLCGPAGAARSEAPVNNHSFVAQPLEAVSADKIFFHKFFREKAERDRVRGVVHPKKSNKNASEGDEKLGRRGSKKRRGADDDLEVFTVDNTADEKQGLGVMDFDEDEDAEEEAFAMHLAEGLMKNSAPDQDDFDDDDPDMEGWSDLGESDEDEDDYDGESGIKPRRATASASRGVIGGGDADDFMEDDSDSDAEELKEDEEDSQAEDTVALRKIADGLTEEDDDDDQDDDDDSEEAEEEEGSGASSKRDSRSGRRVSWLRRGKMAPAYDDDDDDFSVDDDEEEDDDDEQEDDDDQEYIDDDDDEEVDDDDDEEIDDDDEEVDDDDDEEVDDDDEEDYDNRKGRIGGGKPPTAAASKKTTIETDGVEDEVGSDSGEYRKKGQRGNVETAFASFEDYQHILDAWDPDNPDAPLPAGISVPNQKISSSSKKGLGSGRGRGSVRGKGRNGNVGESSGGTGKKRQRRR